MGWERSRNSCSRNCWPRELGGHPLADYNNLIYEKKSDHVVKLTIQRPHVLNAIDYASIVELKKAVFEIAAAPEVRVVIITGSGEKAFIVGADQNELRLHLNDRERARAFEDCCRETFNLIDQLGKLSIAAVNGYAFGLGLQLALACTFRIVSFEARLGLPEINMGFFPSMGATQRLTRLIGEAKAIEMIVTGEPVDANEAYRVGLANRIVSSFELGPVVEDFALKLVEKSPVAVGYAIDAIRHEKVMALKEGLAYEARLSEECLKSEDAKKGMAAFGEAKKGVPTKTKNDRID